MKRISLFLGLITLSISVFSQTVIKMKQEDGISIVPCKVNGLNLTFSFATAEPTVKIALTEANFMFKNRYLSITDILSPAGYANSELTEGVVVNIREIEFAGLKLNNINATVTKDINAPLLLGQSALAKLGPVQMDFANNIITILNGSGNYDFSGRGSNTNTAKPVYTTNTQNTNTGINQMQDASIPKDAPVNVSMTDFKGRILTREIVIFRSNLNGREYQGLTDTTGKFTVRLPAGDKYEIFILGFKDSTSYIVLDIPPLQGKAYYKDPFKVAIQFMPAKSFILEDCNFETGKADLEEDSYKVLDELVAYLNRKEDERIELQGHTDNVGSAKSNMVLSEARANTVRDYLLSKGIDPNRVIAKGYGLTVPVASNNTEEGRAQNRRTEVKILEN
ncbi:MAG: OmpA family protein [Chitinophagaceae bacterium]|nr:OmpA family protein [Chitinophagaceae bacterium]